MPKTYHNLHLHTLPGVDLLLRVCTLVCNDHLLAYSQEDGEERNATSVLLIHEAALSE